MLNTSRKQCRVGKNRFLTPIAMLQAIALIILISPVASTSKAQGNTGTVLVVNFNVPVDPGSAALMSRVVNQARSEGDAAIVIQMNTPGGLLSDMISIISSINDANQSGIPTYTYVPPSSLAASAGSYIAMACNKIAMGTGSAIGPSTPIVVGGTPLEQNHTAAAMLSLMVSLTDKWHRNSSAAYQMVYADRAYSANEAYRFHLMDGFANSLTDALSLFGLQSKPTVTIGEDVYEQFLNAISNPLINGTLILLGTLAIALDVMHPTILLTIIGALALAMGLIGSEVIGASTLGYLVLIIAGTLIFLELKLGHGFAVMAGMVLGAVGIYLLAQGINYVSPSPITSAAELGLFALAVLGVVIGLYIRWIVGPLRQRRSMVGPESLIGKQGTVTIALMPEGEVNVEGIIWRARSISGNLAVGERVTVHKLEGLVLVVEKRQEAAET